MSIGSGVSQATVMTTQGGGGDNTINGQDHDTEDEFLSAKGSRRNLDGVELGLGERRFSPLESGLELEMEDLRNEVRG